MSKTSIKKGQHGGSLRLPAYAYVVRISGANLCDIGTSCNTIIQQLRTHSFPDMVMPYYLSEYPHQILPLPQAVEELKQKGKKKGKTVRLLLV